MALVPFAIFIVITIALSFFNAADTNMMIGAGVIGLLVGMFFAKNLNDYWDTILEGLGSKVAMTAVMLWLVVGIYGNILNRGQIVEGLVWLSVKFMLVEQHLQLQHLSLRQYLQWQQVLVSEQFLQ